MILRRLAHLDVTRRAQALGHPVEGAGEHADLVAKIADYRDILERNPRVTYVIKHYYGDSADRAQAMKCHGHWESVIAEGTARIVAEDEELIAGMKTYMAYYGHGDYQLIVEQGEELRLKELEVV